MSSTAFRAAAAAVGAAVLALAATVAPPAAAVAAPDAGYTIGVGSPVPYAHPTDTPASTYIDKDGTFYFQQSAALYGAKDPRYWEFFTGADMDGATRSGAISDAVDPANAQDKNNDTTWRCNNSPTGREATYAVGNAGYSQKNYCDLSGVWVDPDTGDWYGLVHNEFTPAPFNDGIHFDAIDYAVSKNQGRTWTIKDHAITSPYSTRRGDTAQFPNETYSYGDGDQRLFVDTKSGYFYVYYGSRIVAKGGNWQDSLAHVARSPISSKMARGSWQKWYDGHWTQPGVGGLESNMVPVDASSTTGYTPVAGDYDPANPGTVSQQIAAGQLPPRSPLFVMNIAYDAHLGLYIGEPEAVNGTAPQRFYATDDLASQKWHLIGDTGGYTNNSWYRWFLDGANRTNSTIVGKTFRSYCSIDCQGGADGEYVDVTVDSSTPAAPPFDLGRSYRIGNGDGRVLAQAAGTADTTSGARATGSALESWVFTSDGDGSYRITNASTGGLLGVPTTKAGRAWGAKPTVTAAGPGGPAVGQQWFVVPVANTGSYRLVNRHSGLVIGLSAQDGRLAETTPTRTWTNTTGSGVGGSRSAGEQTLTLTPTGAAPGGPLDGTHTLTASGKSLDDPGHSTTQGTQLVTWSPNGGSNQNWILTRQPDGGYRIVNAESKLCVDVSGGSTAAGAKVIQWACTGGANQRWVITAAPGGGYTLASKAGGLLLTTASGADGALVTQQPDTGSALQRWTLG
ncbi:Extracellular exo-alpha-L-arabinofuranosidase [Streptomyces hundungensis]|uniref:Extracellular exo-alpha-L-arabinofuranosidase n=1 Tax=Streptomyces hundungensis TaxID=1077946 RepID=A0A387HDY5_9ACTN|nr:Extracellular exo-alpha-L-arabinofuranosidase [Streptomyces hundungensis]